MADCNPSVRARTGSRALSCVGLMALLACQGTRLSSAEVDRVDFNVQIRPLLSDRCFPCHGPDERTRKGKLRLDTREGIFKRLDDEWAVVKPGDPAHSELLRRIFATEPDDAMPPPDSKRSLSEDELHLFQQWIEEGAAFKPHWSLNPVQPVEPPKPEPPNGSRNAMDDFVLARLEREGLRLSPEASRDILLRRLAFDLTGLPPSVAELEEFLSERSTNAFERAVDRYLASPAYGERMAMDWLDLARYADTFGYQNDIDRDVSPWRDWVIKAFNENLPYDQFLLWQLAGDLLPNATREQHVATAFNRLHRQTNEGGSIDEELRTEYTADRVNTVGTAMLGLTLECARCHDHKFDPITQRDYYSLFAFFNSIDEAGMYSHFTRATPSPSLQLWPENKQAEDLRLRLRMALAEEKLEAATRKAQGAFQNWLKETGTVQPPRPIARFSFDTVVSNTTPDSVNLTNVAKLVDGPRIVEGRDGQALRFSGDNALVCEGIAHFRRSDEFSFSLWLKPAERQERAVVLHHSRAREDSASRGYELLLDQGRPYFALIHFWPGNAIAIRTKETLPLNEWSQLTVTYDGSSRASGLRIYLNGEGLETEVIRDSLSKDILHRKEWGDSEVGKVHLQLAGRFRDHGFKNGAIDELQVFDTRLTQPEVARLFRSSGPQDVASEIRNQTARNRKNVGASGAEGMKDHFLARHFEPYRVAAAELKELRSKENDLANDVPEIMVMKELSQPRPAFLLRRGAYDAPGDPVQRDTPASVLPFPSDQPRDRLGLARWMIDRRNPLTSRVVVNRIWRMHFGRGLVATQEDFGSQGRLPTHPELLDWLAGWFMDHNWDVKALHRLIVTSATYRQSALASRELLELDPENQWLARGPKRRLLAEQIRDSALAASGLLNRTIGGPSVKPYQPEGLWEQAGTGKKYVQDSGDKLYRRSLYTFWKRISPPPAMVTFDASSREVCTAKRETTTTPLQALVLLNDPQFIEAARALGERVLKESPGDVDARIRSVFRALLSRGPDQKEIEMLRRLVREQTALFSNQSEAAEKLLSVGESRWDRSLPLAEFAATTLLVSAVMNLDEFVVLR